jgi:hypothetical protein
MIHHRWAAPLRNQGAPAPAPHAQRLVPYQNDAQIQRSTTAPSEVEERTRTHHRLAAEEKSASGVGHCALYPTCPALTATDVDAEHVQATHSREENASLISRKPISSTVSPMAG